MTMVYATVTRLLLAQFIEEVGGVAIARSGELTQFADIVAL
ncbi:hypothetical protein [Nocardia sp. XZ_19_385]|nr:hypothetical protein [Nocardia sp. XZ_19_385]